MSNPFQEQFLKAGLVTEKQVKQANQKKKKNKAPQGKKKGPKQLDAATMRAREAAEKKAEKDRELNRRKEEQARNKAISIEIDQLVRDNKLDRSQDCDLPYNFEHRNKVNKLYVNAEIRQKLIDGKLGIARIEGRYEVVPQVIAEKIRERNEKRVILFDQNSDQVDENDPYAEYQVPDDLMW